METDPNILEKLGYTHQSEIVFVITKQDVINLCLDRNGSVGEFEWTEDLVNERMEDFKRALSWGATDAAWDAITEAAVDIECEADW